MEYYCPPAPRPFFAVAEEPRKISSIVLWNPEIIIHGWYSEQGEIYNAFPINAVDTVGILSSTVKSPVTSPVRYNNTK